MTFDIIQYKIIADIKWTVQVEHRSEFELTQDISYLMFAELSNQQHSCCVMCKML